MKRRYEDVRHFHFEGGDADAARVTAAWDGLQVMSLYLNEVDVVAELADYFARTTSASPGADLDADDASIKDEGLVSLPEPPPADESGYARGRERGPASSTAPPRCSPSAASPRPA